MKPHKTLPETALAVVEPAGLIGIESVPASWDRILDMKVRIIGADLQRLALRAMFGAELYVIKKTEGYDIRGGDRRSNPTTSGMIWNDRCREKIGMSDDWCNNQIQIFLTSVERARALPGGEQSPEFRLLVTPPSLLNDEEIETLGGVLDRMLPEKNQNQLLRKIRAAKAPKPAHTLSTADQQKGAAAAAKKKAVGDVLKGSVHFRELYNTLEETEGEISCLRLHRDLNGYLHLLPLTPAPNIIGLLEYQQSFERIRSEIEAGLKVLSGKIAAAIESKPSPVDAPGLARPKTTTTRKK